MNAEDTKHKFARDWRELKWRSKAMQKWLVCMCEHLATC